MITVDFNKPVTTDGYLTWPTTLQASAQGLAEWLDSAVVTPANTPTGAKRYNSTTGIIEQWSGTAWVELAWNYARKDVGTFTARVLSTGNNVPAPGTSGASMGTAGGGGDVAWVYSGGATDSKVWDAYVDGTTMHWRLINDAGNAASEWLQVVRSGYTVNTINFPNGPVAMGGITSAARLTLGNAAEALRVAADTGYISFFNSANNTRTGYLQGNPGANVILAAENGAYLQFNVGGTGRAAIDTSGNLGVGGSALSSARVHALGGDVYVYNGVNAADNGGAIGFGVSALNNYSIMAAIQGRLVNATGTEQQGGIAFLTRPNGSAGQSLVERVRLDQLGNLLVGSTSAQYSSAGRGVVEVNGSSTSIYALKVGGSGVAYLYHDGVNLYLSNELNQPLYLKTNSIIRQTINSNGSTTFAGGVATTTNAMGNVAGGAVTIDCSKSNTHSLTLTANMTGLTLSNMQDGQTVNVQITQDGTGTRTWAGVTSANNYIWPGGVVQALSTAANAVDLAVFTKVGSKIDTTLTKDLK